MTISLYYDKVALEAEVQAGRHRQVVGGLWHEIGQLQVGFTRMMEEAIERRQLQDLFGRHVGEEVARRAVDTGAALGGETRFVAVLFVDMVGSTATAAESSFSSSFSSSVRLRAMCLVTPKNAIKAKRPAPFDPQKRGP